MRNALLCSLFLLLVSVTGSAKPVHHYVFFGMDRENLKVYANFMPGEWLPREDAGYLRSVYEAARKLNVGVGGPDLLPYKESQMGASYPLIRASASQLRVGVAVQDGDYQHVNPKTGKQVSIAEIINFGKEYLGVDYIFWCAEEPYYSKQLVPFMKKL